MEPIFEGPWADYKNTYTSSNYILFIHFCSTWGQCPFVALRLNASLEKGRLCSPLKSTPLHSFTDSFSLQFSPANTVTAGGVTSAETSPILSHTCGHKSVCVFVLWLWQTLDLTTQCLGAHVNMTQKGSESTSQNRNKQFNPNLIPT